MAGIGIYSIACGNGGAAPEETARREPTYLYDPKDIGSSDCVPFLCVGCAFVRDMCSRLYTALYLLWLFVFAASDSVEALVQAADCGCLDRVSGSAVIWDCIRSDHYALFLLFYRYF